MILTLVSHRISCLMYLMSANTNHYSLIVDMSLCMELSHLSHIHVFLCSMVLAQWSVSVARSLTLFSDHSGWRQRRFRSPVTTFPLKRHRQQPRLLPWTLSSSRPRCDDHAYESYLTLSVVIHHRRPPQNKVQRAGLKLAPTVTTPQHHHQQPTPPLCCVTLWSRARVHPHPTPPQCL